MEGADESNGGQQRFLLELEFVQCLANPTYIHYLAQNRYFDDEAFVNYLKYLQYWRRPEYAKFIMYPHCLFFLELLQSSHFRAAMVHPANKELAHRQQFYFWKHYRSNRLKHVLPRPMPEAAAVTTAATTAAVAAPPPSAAAPPLALQHSGHAAQSPAPAPPPSLLVLPPQPSSSSIKTSGSGGGERRKRKYSN